LAVDVESAVRYVVEAVEQLVQRDAGSAVQVFDVELAAGAQVDDPLPTMDASGEFDRVDRRRG
jgi:hypothetical protein